MAELSSSVHHLGTKYFILKSIGQIVLKFTIDFHGLKSFFLLLFIFLLYELQHHHVKHVNCAHLILKSKV